jgi:predicted nucleic acid-binding protein
MMHKKVYFDTNVIVDLFDEGRINHKFSLEVLNTVLENEEIEVFINSDTVTNLFYILRHHVKLSFDDSLKKLVSIKDIFDIICIEKQQCELALDICKKHIFKDYEDCLQYVCAAKEGCTLIITNNPKDFKNSSIDIATTKELSDMWRIQ